MAADAVPVVAAKSCKDVLIEMLPKFNIRSGDWTDYCLSVEYQSEDEQASGARKRMQVRPLQDVLTKFFDQVAFFRMTRTL